jgi:hypothetical protein
MNDETVRRRATDHAHTLGHLATTALVYVSPADCRRQATAKYSALSSQQPVAKVVIMMN